MANTFTSLHYHIIFSTKNREPWIDPPMDTRVWAFMAGIARENKIKPIQIGGASDHIHLLLGIAPTIPLSKAVQLIKGGASLWIKTEFNKRAFAWQDGYAAFTVSKSILPEVIEYIQNQREHHRTKTFQEEYLAFLQRHEVPFDPRYVFD